MRPISRLVVACACLIPAARARAADPPRRYEVVTPRRDGIVATGINARGDVIGFEWLEDPKAPGVVGQEPFLFRAGKLTRLPLLPTYTATFPAAVSDAGLVVGRAGKPATGGQRIRMQNQAFTWTEADGIRPLPTLPDDWASFATGISRDGNWISGLSVGDNRMTPCVWERINEEGRLAWKPDFLVQVDPRICSQVLPMSDDGRRVAGVDGSLPTLWTREGAVRWAAEAIGPPGSISPRAVNDAGAVAGVVSPADGSTHAVVWTRAGGVRRLPEPAGYAHSEALAINNAGAVVGMIDGPHGSPIGPRAFVFEGDRLRILDEGGPNFTSATALNDRGQVAGAFEAEEAEAGPDPAAPPPPAKPAAPSAPRP